MKYGLAFIGGFLAAMIVAACNGLSHNPFRGN